MYSDIINEYIRLLSRKEVVVEGLSTLPKGYISKKTINGKEYKYLQSRKEDKIVSYYIKSGEEEYFVEGVARRKEWEKELPAINNRLKELEHAANLLDAALARKMIVLKLCWGMDALPVEMKKQCFAFSDTMTSIEGVSAGREVKEAMEDWIAGKVSILSVFENVLSSYGFDKEATL